MRPRKTIRGKHSVIPPAARSGRRPGKKPHSTRRSQPKAPPVDDTEVDELVRIIYHPFSNLSVSSSQPQQLGIHQATGGRGASPLLLPKLGRLGRQMGESVGRQKQQASRNSYVRHSPAVACKLVSGQPATYQGFKNSIHVSPVGSEGLGLHCGNVSNVGASLTVESTVVMGGTLPSPLLHNQCNFSCF